MTGRLLTALLDELAADPVALERLRELVDNREAPPVSVAPAYTPRTLAAELGRSERSIRGAITRGELEAVKRGRGWVIAADAVRAWAAAPANPHHRGSDSRPRRRSGPGPMARALRER